MFAYATISKFYSCCICTPIHIRRHLFVCFLKQKQKKQQLSFPGMCWASDALCWQH